jgi:hypothetical protein
MFRYGLSSLGLIVGGDRNLLLNLPDFLGRMLPEETLHIRRKFALTKIRDKALR